MEGSALADFLARIDSQTTVLLDEAYTEYLAPEQRYDSIALVRAHPNLVLARTFSKAYGLAGLRVGYAVAQPELAKRINALRPRFNVNAPAQAAAIAALNDRAFEQQTFATNLAGRAKMEQGFAALGLECMPSSANFLTVRFADARAMHQHLLGHGIHVAPLDIYGLPSWLRITVGTAGQIQKLLKFVAEWQPSVATGTP